MPLDCYLAMTAAEFISCPTLPSKLAWMACHFSCYGTGLSNQPQTLPPGSMVIVNDRTPVFGHDPAVILKQLSSLVEELGADSVLLDLQRPNQSEAARIAHVLTRELPCPVGVSALYAKDLQCPVFLDPPPPHHTLQTHIAPWQDREIWLEAEIGCWEMTVDRQGSRLLPIPDVPLPDPWFQETQTCCRYHLTHSQNEARFLFRRTRQDLEELATRAKTFGVTRMVGLYQQLQSAD